MGQLNSALLANIGRQPQIQQPDLVGSFQKGVTGAQQIGLNRQKLQNLQTREQVNQQLLDINQYKIDENERKFIEGEEDKAFSEEKSLKMVDVLGDESLSDEDVIEGLFKIAIDGEKDDEKIAAAQKTRADAYSNIRETSAAIKKARADLASTQAKTALDRSKIGKQKEFAPKEFDQLNDDLTQMEADDETGTKAYARLKARADKMTFSKENKKKTYKVNKYEKDDILSKMDEDESLKGLPEGDKNTIASEVVRRSKEYIDNGMDGVQAEQQAYDEIINQYIDPANSGRKFVPFDSKDASLINNQPVQNVPNAGEGQVARNPTTGETIIMRNGKWEPM